MDINWTEELLAQVRPLARKHQFDWTKIAEELRNSAASVFSLDLRAPQLDFISAQSVRAAFATQNEVRIPPPAATSATAVKVSPNDSVSATLAASSVASLDFDNMSVDDIFAAVEAEEEKLMRKKEEVFMRVLKSLTGDDEDNSSLIPTIQDPATSAFYEAKRQREEARAQAEKRRREHQERAKLEAERDALRRRFDSNAAEAVGERYEPVAITPVEMLEAKLAAYQGEKGEKDEFMGSILGLMHQPANVDLEAVFGGGNIDDLLTELEQELESQAMGKMDAASSDKREPSELDRLFALLDAADTSIPLPSRPASSHLDAQETAAATESQSEDANFAMFQAELAQQMPFLLPRPPTTAAQKTSAAKSGSSIDQSAQIKKAPPVKSHPATSSTVPPIPPSANSATGGAKGRRAEYMSASGASTSASAVTDSASKRPKKLAEPDDDDSGDDLFTSSRARMKSAATQFAQQKPVSTPSGHDMLLDTAQLLLEKQQRSRQEQLERELQELRRENRVSDSEDDSDEIDDSRGEVEESSNEPLSVRQTHSLERDSDDEKPDIDGVPSVAIAVMPPAPPVDEERPQSTTSDSTSTISTAGAAVQLSGSLLATSRTTGSKARGKGVIMSANSRKVPSNVVESAVKEPIAAYPSTSSAVSNEEKGPQVEVDSSLPPPPSTAPVAVVPEVTAPAEPDANLKIINQPVIDSKRAIFLAEDSSSAVLEPLPFHDAPLSDMILAVIHIPSGAISRSQQENYKNMHQLASHRSDHHAFLLLEWLTQMKSQEVGSDEDDHSRNSANALEVVGYFHNVTSSAEEEEEATALHYHAPSQRHLVVLRQSSPVTVSTAQLVANLRALLEQTTLSSVLSRYSSSVHTQDEDTNISVAEAVTLLDVTSEVVPASYLGLLSQYRPLSTAGSYRKEVREALFLAEGLSSEEAQVGALVFRPVLLSRFSIPDSSTAHNSIVTHDQLLQRGVLSATVQTAECSGLRLIGARMLYVDSNTAGVIVTSCCADYFVSENVLRFRSCVVLGFS